MFKNKICVVILQENVFFPAIEQCERYSSSDDNLLCNTRNNNLLVQRVQTSQAAFQLNCVVLTELFAAINKRDISCNLEVQICFVH